MCRAPGVHKPLLLGKQSGIYCPVTSIIRINWKKMRWREERNVERKEQNNKWSFDLHKHDVHLIVTVLSPLRFSARAWYAYIFCFLLHLKMFSDDVFLRNHTVIQASLLRIHSSYLVIVCFPCCRLRSFICWLLYCISFAGWIDKSWRLLSAIFRKGRVVHVREWNF